MLDEFLYLVALASALAGISLASYIYWKKRRHETMVCPIGSDCTTVTGSVFSKFLGIPVELLGIGYYGSIILFYVAYLIWPTSLNSPLILIAFGISLAAFIFSTYLTFIQAFTLRKWCTWCLSSAGLTSLIFLVSLKSVNVWLIDFLAEWSAVILALHVLGVVIGMGAATAADIFFFKFLRDLRISENEAETLHTLSQVVWLGLGIVFLTGVAIVMPRAVELLSDSKFLVKMLVVAVITINGAFLNLHIAPRLVHIYFGEHDHMPGELRRLRRMAYALGAVSFTSWYSAFGLAFWKNPPFNFWQILAGYLGLIALAIIGSQWLDLKIAKRGSSK